MTDLPAGRRQQDAIVAQLLPQIPGLARLLVVGLGFLAAAMGVQVIWPGTRVTRLEAAGIVTNGRVDSVAAVLRGHLTDEALYRRASMIWLCLHSEPADQDMLQLPCTQLLLNAAQRTRRGR